MHWYTGLIMDYIILHYEELTNLELPGEQYHEIKEEQ